MTTQTPEQYLAALEAELADTTKGKDVYAREERVMIAKLAIVEGSFMPEAILQRRQIDTDSDEFKAAYPYGLPALHIGLEGVDVKFTGVADGLLHLYIPTMGDRPDTFGRKKGRRSQAHIVSEAFEKVFGKRPYGTENQAFLRGSIAVWGQHLGDMEADGETREWAWDIPRKILPRDYQHGGPVREINIGRRDDDGTASAGPGGVAQLDDEDSINAILAAVVGMDDTDLQGTAEAILNIPGLPAKFANAAMDKKHLALLGTAGRLGSENGKLIRLEAVAAG